ncbi:hypothetical protein ACFLXG_02875 [Chloroflexota bacterium]
MVTKETINIYLIGDYEPDYPSHRATVEALRHSAEHIPTKINISWIPTSSLQEEGWKESLIGVDGLWLTPGAPYQSQEGAHRSISFARERKIPFFAT